jgi:hypothetical protein
MTVLVIKGSIFASDSGITADGLLYSRGTKIKRLCDGSLIGFCGEFMPQDRVFELVEYAIHNNKTIDMTATMDIERLTALLLRKTGVWILETGKNYGVIKLEGKYFAEGSAWVPAMAALHMGASAQQAVKIACKLSKDCALPVQTMRLQ